MARLIETQGAASRQLEVCQAAPGLLRSVLAENTRLAQGGNFRVQIVRNQIKLVHIILVRRMNGHLSRRELEDQPAIVCVNKAESEHVPEQGAVCLCILGVNDDVSAVDHGTTSTSR